MSVSVPCRGAVIIGAMTPKRSRSPFNRGHLVVRAPDGRLVRAQTFTADDHTHGPQLSDEDWRELLDSEQTLAHPDAALSPGAALWALRAPFHRRDRALQALRSRGVLLCPYTLDGDAWLCLVDESRPAAAELRDHWQREATDQALKHARADEWPRALEEAELAHAVGRSLDPESLALLHLVYERLGRETAAAGLVVMARRSRGEPFAAQLLEHLSRLRAEPLAARGDPRLYQAGLRA
jgi:hypothetical protein